MKSNIYIYTLLPLAYFFLVSCDRNTSDIIESSGQTIPEPSENYKVTINKKKLEPQNVFEILASDPDYYSSMAIPTNHTITLMSRQRSPLTEEKIYSFISNRTRTKSHDNQVFLNNIAINNDTRTKSNDNKDLKKLFGTNVTISLATNHTKSSDTEELYIPEILHISAPDIKEQEDLYPLCDYSNFVLRWNKDTNNQHGVFVYVRWNGTMAIGEQYSDTSIERLDIVPDTGEITLNPHLFDDIPDAAVCTLYIGRGATDIYQIDNDSYKIIGESHESLKFILIRELKNIQL